MTCIIIIVLGLFLWQDKLKVAGSWLTVRMYRIFLMIIQPYCWGYCSKSWKTWLLRKLSQCEFLMKLFSSSLSFHRCPREIFLCSAMLNPLSAIIASPISSLLIRPDCITSSLSDMDPPYNGEMKDKAPDGVIPTKTLAVLWFLYDEKVNCCVWKYYLVSEYILQ